MKYQTEVIKLHKTETSKLNHLVLLSSMQLATNSKAIPARATLLMTVYRFTQMPVNIN